MKQLPDETCDFYVNQPLLLIIYSATARERINLCKSIMTNENVIVSKFYSFRRIIFALLVRISCISQDLKCENGYQTP